MQWPNLPKVMSGVWPASEKGIPSVVIDRSLSENEAKGLPQVWALTEVVLEAVLNTKFLWIAWIRIYRKVGKARVKNYTATE